MLSVLVLVAHTQRNDVDASSAAEAQLCTFDEFTFEGVFHGAPACSVWCFGLASSRQTTSLKLTICHDGHGFMLLIITAVLTCLAIIFIELVA